MIQFEKPFTYPSGVVTNFHVVTKVELDRDMETLVVHMASWFNQAAFETSRPALDYTTVRLDLLTNFATLKESIATKLTTGWLEGAVRVPVTSTLDIEKAKRVAAVTQAHQTADRTSFTFRGKEIRADLASLVQISAISQHLDLNNSFPVGWPGGWKAIDNTFVTLTTREDWAEFIAAMVTQGTVNFAKAQTLKSAILAATTLEELEQLPIWN